jgi:formylglycine-generating enzyme required for sulfatase activity
MVARIFLCHASEDKAQVREVYHQLKALGFAPWLDEMDILPGQKWDYEIKRALETSDFVLVFLSTRSVGKIGYVQREFRRALYHAEEMPEGFIHTIPVKLDDCAVPRRFSRHQWANLYEAGAFDRIVCAINAGLLQRQQSVNQTQLEGLSEKTELAAIRTQMLKADSVWELREALYSTEKLLERYPNNPEARLLKDQLERAIQYELTPETQAPPYSISMAVGLTNSIGMEFVLIPAGTFMMGSPDSDAEAYDDERPAHQVIISQPFYLGKYPVTHAQWEAVMGNRPSFFKGNPYAPVEAVSWDDVHAFLRKLNEQEEGGGDYRLPTEAQWEYACRAGTETPWYHPDVNAIAWYKGNTGGFSGFGGKPQTVGQKLPNAWGLYDMLGNVWEWCHDGKRTYTADAAVDPMGPTGAGAVRVIRGGGWNCAAQDVRAALRFWFPPGRRADHLGFRCASSGPSK